MSNSTIDTKTIDYTEGEDCMKALYNERNCVSATWDDCNFEHRSLTQLTVHNVR